MRISEHLRLERIRCGVSATTKAEALKEVADLISSSTPAISTDEILQSLQEREKQGPFSMVKGTVFPHARSEAIPDFTIALATSPAGIDFRAPGDQLIHVVVLFAIPKKHTNLYLHALASCLSFFQVDENLRRILDAKSPREILAAFDAPPSRPFGQTPGDLPYKPMTPVHLDTPVNQVITRIKTESCDALPVVDPAGSLIGEIRANALLSAADATRSRGAMPVSGFPDLLLRQGFTCIQESESPEQAVRALSTSGASYAYVLRGRKLVGRLSARDLIAS